MLGGHSWLVLMVLDGVLDGEPQSFFERKRTEVRWDDLPSCGGNGFEDGFNHQSVVAPGCCDAWPRGLISGASKINGFKGFELDGKTWENLSLSSKGQCFSATVTLW